ncbi:hypothetical protein COLO4_31120 [Corchorus olitorius]|uniref:Uncharacterized protein n=1 Tax=Corchorus olitorius TaxID=93759 RepID=A0A1R3H5H0_9ROSI|nr:hypothetical protein COLO4_31120 [Corchorus olitorius]
MGEIVINGGSKRYMKSENGEDEESEEYEVEELRDRMKSSRGSRFNLIANEFGLAAGRARRRFSRQTVIDGIKDLSRGVSIHPDNRDSQTYRIVYKRSSIAIS